MKLYIEILQNQFEKIRRSNPAYTLKEFSADAGVKPGRMSDMFNGHYGLSEAVAINIAKAISIDEKTTELFILSVRAHHARDHKSRVAAQKKLHELSQQRVDLAIENVDFEQMNDWYYLAIVHLIKKDPLLTESDIALRLSIPQEEVNTAIKSLKTLDLIDEHQYFKHKNDTLISIDNNVASHAIQKHHRQILNKAIEALPITPIEKKDFASCQMLIDEQDLPKIKEQLVEFRRKLIREHAKDTKGSILYSFSYQLFNLEKEVSS